MVPGYLPRPFLIPEMVEVFSCRKVFVTREKLEDDEIEILGPEDIVEAAISGNL
jgi:hypothetical protein